MSENPDLLHSNYTHWERGDFSPAESVWHPLDVKVMQLYWERDRALADLGLEA